MAYSTGHSMSLTASCRIYRQRNVIERLFGFLDRHDYFAAIAQRPAPALWVRKIGGEPARDQMRPSTRSTTTTNRMTPTMPMPPCP